MYTLSTLISGMSIGLALLLLAHLVFHLKHSYIARWLSLYCVSALAYMLRPYGPDSFTLLDAVGQFLAPAVAVAMLGFAKSLFLETPRLSALEWAITTIYMGLSFTAYLNHALAFMPGDYQATTYVVLRVLPQILKISLIVTAIYFTVKHTKTDLVEARRQLRFLFVLGFSFFLIFFFASELVYSFNFPGWLKLAHDILILSIWCLVTLWFFSFRMQEIDNLAGQRLSIDVLSIPTDAMDIEATSNKRTSATEPPHVDVKVLARLEELMTQDNIYHQPGLTISTLAKSVDLPEHHLRRIINQHLGYRNFNNYLNHYRIEEASRVLQDKSKSQDSIFVIAMDAGFNSLAPFNRAFKAETGLSPSEYRKLKLGT